MINFYATYSLYCAAVVIAAIRYLPARLSVPLSITYFLFIQKEKRHRKAKIYVNIFGFSGAEITGVPGRPHNMLALGRHRFFQLSMKSTYVILRRYSTTIAQ